MSTQKSKTAAIALIVAAIAIAAGILSKSWFTADRGDAGVGLTGIQECHRGECQSASWGDLPDAPGTISTFGYLGFIAGLLAAIGSGVVGGMMLAGRGRKLPAKQVGAVLGGGLTVAALCQLTFINRVLDTGNLSRMSIGWALVVAIAGAIAGAIIVRVMVVPALAAAADAAPAPAPAPQPYTVA